MQIEKAARELMLRYLKAVARYLPISKREDISKEIESMIYDICEERYGDSDIDERRMESILVEIGKPSRLASKYREDRPLIGPELTPIFKLVLIIVCLVTAIASLIDFALGISAMNAGQIWLYFFDLFGSLTGVVGTIFIIFFILERAIRNKSGIDFDEDKWKIKDLPELSEKVPGRAEIVAGLIFSVIAIIVINLFFDRIGIYSVTDGTTRFTPILTDSLKSLLPLFSLRIAVGAAVLLPFTAAFDRISAERRNYFYQLSQIGLAVFDIGIIFLLLSRGADQFLVMDALENAGIGELAGMVGKIFTGILLLLLGLNLWNLIKRMIIILPKQRWRV